MTRYAMYVHDYGAPIGWRLALADPGAVTAIITQSGNGYEAGFTEEFWKPVRECWQDQDPPAGWRPFLLESHLDTAAGSIRRFLERTLP